VAAPAVVRVHQELDTTGRRVAHHSEPGEPDALARGFGNPVVACLRVGNVTEECLDLSAGPATLLRVLLGVTQSHDVVETVGQRRRIEQANGHVRILRVR
jgi:hypothetical protein